MDVRFGHLLQPIRDLAQNWNVDVASELEDYLHEIEELDFAFDGSKEKLNFAEAALLIQGSACVYSKKVEYLYKLVYETLDLLASKRKQAQKSSLDDDGNDNDVQTFATDEESFLPLDDLPEDNNINLDEASQSAKSTMLTRTPMVLVPLEACEKTGDSVLVGPNGTTFGNKSDFKMNTSLIHETGALLLGVEDVQFMDSSFQAPNGSGTSNLMTSNMMASTLAAVDENDEDGPADHDDHDFGDDGGWDGDEDQNDVEHEVQHAGAVDSTDIQKANLNPGFSARESTDPWAALDPFDVTARGSAAKSTFRAIKSYRIPSHLTETSSKKSKKKTTKEVPLCPITEFCAQAFSGTRSRNLPKGLRAPDSEYLDLAHFYSAEHLRRTAVLKKSSALLKQKQIEADTDEARALKSVVDPLELSAVTLNTSEDFADDNDFGGYDNDDDDFAPPNDVEYATVEAAGLDVDATDAVMNSAPDYAAAHSEAAAVTYEDLVRAHIDAYIAETQKYAIETDLTKRLTEWEDRIKPALVAESKRDAFDIHTYGSTVMRKFDEKKDKGKFKPFEKLAGAKDSFEVSRMFLATLQLANAGNVQIKSSTTCNMEVKLLSTTTHHSQIDAALAPLLV